MIKGKGSKGVFGKRGALFAPFALPIVMAFVSAPAAAAEIKLPDVSVGGGLRTSFVSKHVDGAAQDVNDFNLDSVRLYVSGSVTDYLKFNFDTDYSSATSQVNVIDAIARFEFSPSFNIWAGRFLPPSDRANLNGPYYSNEWGFATEGVQDGFPFFAAGRDNGVAYWGDFGGLKLSAGVFDVPSTTGNEKVVTAARAQYDFWDKEAGYYLNGTYYGDKDILALGVSGQAVSGNNAVTVDGLLEKKITGGGVVSAEAEYAKYKGFGGYTTSTVAPTFANSDGFFVLGGYLFPQQVGVGKFQLLGKYAKTNYDGGAADFDQKTTEVDVNYVIKSFNARLSLFYIGTDFDAPAKPNFSQVGLGLQIQI